MALNSPFTCGGVPVTLNAEVVHAKLTIRVDNAPANVRVVVKINGIPSLTNVDYYLLAGESITLTNEEVEKASEVSVLNITGDPNIYFSIT